jgi:ABC-type transport system substrate-binding protein
MLFTRRTGYAVCFLVASTAGAGDVAPGPLDIIRPSDLARLAKAAPPAWAEVFSRLARGGDTIIGDDGLKYIVSPLPFPFLAGPDAKMEFQLLDKKDTIAFKKIKSVIGWEETVLSETAKLDKDASPADLQAVEWLLRAALRYHHAHRQRPPEGANPWQDLEQRLQDRLIRARAEVLRAPAETKQAKEAGKANATAWLDLSPRERSIQEAAADLLLGQARDALKGGDAAAARSTLLWLEQRTPALPALAKLRDEMEAQAKKWFEEALGLPEGKAATRFRQALELWPQLPDAADELARLDKRYRVLYVAVPSLPRHLTPVSAWTVVEKQALDLLYCRLTRSALQQEAGRYHATEVPDLALQLPWPSKRALPVDLRTDRFWSDGQPVTAADVRHTYDLALGALAARHPLLRTSLEKPRLPEQTSHLTLKLRDDLFDPFQLTRLHLLPWRYHDAKTKALVTLDDPLDAGFERKPVGSGPFYYAGTQKDKGGLTVVVFKANPGYARALKQPVYIGEVRFFVWPGPDPKNDLRPDVVFFPRAANAAALAGLGLRRPALAPGVLLHVIAANQRRPALALPEVRLALAHGVDRAEALVKWNKGIGDKDARAEAASGPFPRGSWRYPGVDLLKAEPFSKGSDRSFVRQAKDVLKAKELKLTLLYPDDDPRIKDACAQLAQNWKAFADAGLDLQLELKALAPHDLQEALQKRDYDLAWHTLDDPEDFAALWSLFDDRDDAVDSPLGGNFFGHRNDGTLTSLFQTALKPQPFPDLQLKHQQIHVHLYKTMPFVPLWHEPLPLALHSTLETGVIDPHDVFGRVLHWNVPARK